MHLASTQFIGDTPELERELAKVIEPKRVLTRLIDRVAFASDASFYRLIPQAVVLARDFARYLAR